jgi:hypothetical protein
VESAAFTCATVPSSVTVPVPLPPATTAAPPDRSKVRPPFTAETVVRMGPVPASLSATEMPVIAKSVSENAVANPLAGTLFTGASLTSRMTDALSLPPAPWAVVTVAVLSMSPSPLPLLSKSDCCVV